MSQLQQAGASGYHMGRSFVGTRLEDDCPCQKAPCGLVVVEEAVADCPQHSLTAAKSMRQIHPAYACPGTSTPTQ